MEIGKTLKGTTNPKPKDSELGFGKLFTDHMFIMNYDVNKGWYDPRIVPYGNLSLDPAAMVLHYNQEVFEGLKAYALADGGIGLFRPEMNIARMNKSAERMVMPHIDDDLFLRGMKELILVDKEWLPKSEGTSLYIRPTMIADEPALGVRPSNTYIFFIIISPVGPYYPGGFNPTRIFVSDQYVRAARGGVGEAKTSGNYGPTLYVSKEATKNGFTQVLWLDAKEHKYVEEVGTSNIFFFKGNELVTPPLAGTILPGITRNSVIQIAKHWDIKVSERPIAIDEVIEGIESGAIKEVFATGTAAVISPVGEIGYKGKNFAIAGGKAGELAQKLYDEIFGIQYAKKEDPFGWLHRVA